MKKKVHVQGVWTTVENGYEKTKSHTLIMQTISHVMKKRRFVNLLSNKYQSGATVFVSFDHETLTIDKPMAWPALKRVRVVFKDDAKVWNHFTVSVTGEGKDTVKTEFPTELFRRQRRAHFRIDVPRGSTASFVMENDAVLEDVAVSNIGLGGLLICFAVGAQPTIKDQEVISNIEVTLLPSGDAADTKQEETEVFYIEKGVCVRSFIDKAAGKSCLGVEFKPKPAEEMKLMQFIRQLELNELRKGVAQQ